MVAVNLTDAEKKDWQAYLALDMYARDAMGPEQWRLVESFGKIMDGGLNGGLYVSGVSTDEARAIVNDLMQGRIVEVHLMHRHRSGVSEVSSLCRHAGRLVMLFDNRSEFA